MAKIYYDKDADLKVYKGRNGSIGSEILKRFNLFFDYTNKKLYLKKNGFFRELIKEIE